MVDKVDRIAIVGSSCRFPGGSNSPSKLWELLKDPIDLVAEIPQSRFNATGFYHENAEHPGTTNVTTAYLLDHDPWKFDNEFFNISAREAESMDPQQRLILEIVYESLENAGCSMSKLRGSSTGVFVGQMSDDYRDLVLRDVDSHAQHTGTGIARSILANRVSYAFDLKGPSVNIDTACSSSLVALHLAIQSLRSGESEMAIVAGVNLIFSPEMFSFLSSLRMLSPNGRSSMWDASADGYARGEGFAAVIIKTLDKALADGDDIESIIRNTGVNQDGRSAGLTVPSATAQAELMRSTYARCGLDCQKKEDRCQYFEAHGTGTPAGDPKEAEAINATFFSNHVHEGFDESWVAESQENDKIYVGSIKTVIGHSEGTAGLASVLKASQAVKHGLLPPNLHFNQLNKAIEPHYDHLEVPSYLKSWPKLTVGAPRRASVNSFGFGGTNAHVIIESWQDNSMIATPQYSSSCWGPFVLSANTEKALGATIPTLSAALKSQDDFEPARLSWTLQTRRTQFMYRASFVATSKEDLITRLDSAIANAEQIPLATKAIVVPKARILGVFTGQGAQWASMGSGLFLNSESFRRMIQQLETVLREIPDGPTWSLTEELLRENDHSRTSSVDISQSLCTAVQLALVDLLKECGIEFDAVLGHSSGEIAAAYAAGVLGAKDAILVAYYRGYHCLKIQNSHTKAGKMMAVGMSPMDADSFCRQPRFLGRIILAAKNSLSSVTLSGDGDAIDEAKILLDGETVFSRILKVNVAYHSHHMESVQESYLASLKEADIQPIRKCFRGTCTWYSSVYGPENDNMMDTTIAFKDSYWVKNMTNPVLFSHAIASAVKNEHFDLALEIGPHPALRGPATETIKEVLGNSFPYHGVLERNKNALNTFSEALGFVWRSIHSPVPLVDFEGFQRACNGPNWTSPRVHKGIPSYSWDHDRSLLKESRKSKSWRTRATPFDDLLGYPDSVKENQEIRWRNILRFSDLQWLQGHQFQKQVLLPAAGYLAMATNAALHLVGHIQTVQLVELQNVVIRNGITLEEGSPGVEINFVIKMIEQSSAGKLAEFSCHCNNSDADSPEFEKEVFTGRVFLKIGPPTEDVLPNRALLSLPMTDVTIDRFYHWMQQSGLQYSKPFVLDSIKRRLNLATVTTTRTVDDKYIIHPGTLDSILQGLYAAFSYAGDGRVWTTYLPKSFGRVRFNMRTCRHKSGCSSPQLVADCYITESSAQKICGDINVFCTADNGAEIQAQDVVFSSLEIPSSANDRNMFWKTTWKRSILSDIETTDKGIIEAPKDHDLYEVCERTVYFYLKKLCREVNQEHVASMEWHFQCLMNWALDSVHSTSHSGPLFQRQAHWDTDTIEVIKGLKDQYDDQIDLELVHNVGSRLPSIMSGIEPTLQVLKKDGMLEKLYTAGLGVPQTNNNLGEILDHLAHQHARMRILEIGGGTGGSTSVALQHLDSKLEDYTFTDLSPSFFPAAKARFNKQRSMMRFQVLDIERQPVEQGFLPHSYDLIIAAHVLHATRSISQTLQHCRELLRPGGYLILLELTNPNTLRIPFIFSGLPGWWLGDRDGRDQGPTLTEAHWDVALRENRFSGVDRALRDFRDDSMHSFSVMVTQAVDDRVNILRDPLNLATGVISIKHLFIIGGHTLTVSKMALRIRSALSPFAEQTTIINDLEGVLTSDLKYGSTIICLSGLEEAEFARMNQQRVSAIKTLFREAKFILWVTRGCRSHDPYANIIVGIGRSVTREMAHLRLKFVDIERVHSQRHQREVVIFSEMLLQMICLEHPNYGDILWSNETEVTVEDAVVLIPRVVPDESLNNRFNATRRKITTNLSHKLHPVEVSVAGGGLIVTEMRSDFLKSPPDNLKSLHVLSSSMFRFTCSDEDQPFFVCLGYSGDEKQQVLALSAINGSLLSVPSDCVYSCKVGIGPDEVLSAILAIIMCESLLFGCSGELWVHNADDFMAEVIIELAKQKGVSVFLTTSNSASRLISMGKSVFIHPLATQRERKALIPQNVNRFMDMGGETQGITEFTASLALPPHVVSSRGFHNLPLEQIIALSNNRASFGKILEDCCSRSDWLRDLGLRSQKIIVKADHIHEQKETAMARSIISWSNISDLQVRVMPATTDRLFGDAKTYFLVGLTGDVGISLCEWMVDHGAKYLAIASRNPNVPPELLIHLQKTGVTIRIFSLDVANMESLTAAYLEIVRSMPPIAGVANAALVVRDHPFDGMSCEDLEVVFKPKVVGTQNLDKLFSSTQLEFFVLFSSVASIVGKPAQSSYNAANLFMSTVAVRRRARGMAASIMHFGMLLGLGFIHGQAGPTVEARFRQDDLPAISEPEFHAIFAQAIVSGRPESGLDPELIAGLGTEIDTPWRAMSRFGHCRIKGEERTATENRHEQPIQSIQKRLKECSDIGQASAILNLAIASRLRLALGSPSEGMDEYAPLLSLGLDSLVAVEVRSWLMKILEVNVPALKFLSGASLKDICNHVLNELPSGLRPWAAVDEKQPHEEINGHNDTFEQEEEQSGYTDYEKVGEMSYAQAQLYFLHEYLQNNAYNVAYSGNFQGQLNISKFQKALLVVGKRHEALRSSYFVENSTARPVQAVLSEPHIIVKHSNISDDSQAQAEIDSVKDFRFEIEKGVVMKVTVMSKSPILHYMIFSHHHIALDGISWSIFIADLAAAYSGRLTHEAAPPRVQQSIEMSKNQAKALTPQVLSADLEFWRNIFITTPEPLPLFPFAKVKARPTVKDYSINTSDVKLSGDVTKLVGNAASKIGVTSFHFYLASLAAFLARCLDITDIAIGIVDANRSEVEDMDTVGYFLNMLPVRVGLDKSDEFDKVAKSVRDSVLSAMAHPHTPLDMILGADGLDVSRSTSHHPLFQVAINYRKAPLNETDFGVDGKIQWDGAVPGGNPYDMLLNVAATTDWTFLSLVTQRNLYEASDGGLLLKWFTRYLEALAEDPSCEIGLCPISTETDIQEAIELGQNKDTKVPWKGTIVDRVDQVAVEMPVSIAIRDGHQAFTYAQMSNRVIQIASNLQAVATEWQSSLSPGTHVAMLLDPSYDAVCSMLAILRLDLVLIPLDTRNHPQRLQAMIKESRPRVLVYHSTTRQLAQQMSEGTDLTSLLNVDDGGLSDNKDGTVASSGRLVEGNGSNHPAVILYTSGSTGLPKGVILTHGGLLTQVHGTITHLHLGRETTLQQSPLGFDLTLDQIFLALCNGGTIVIVSKDKRGDPTEIAHLIVSQGVTLTHFVPSEYLALLNYGNHVLKNAHSWRYAMSGGEKLGQELVRAFYKLDLDTLKLVNVYGPAEVTIACARGVVPYREMSIVQESNSDHLRPSPNYGLEIIDADMNILPVGFPGEICISGPGVGLGYLQLPEETSRKFVMSKSVQTSSKATRIYRSGDKGRLLTDGTLKVLGRLDGDTQVKINGFRVELNEIANAIVHISNGTIVNAAASLRRGQPSDLLIAFVVFDIEFTGDHLDFIKWLQSNIPLPPVMTPTRIIPISRIPVTYNGKTDRDAVDRLPITDTDPVSSRTTYTSTQSLSYWEESVKDVWEEVLSARAVRASGLRPTIIEPTSDFFQIGGSSILMIKLKSLLEVQFGVKVSMPELFEASILSSMASLVSNAKTITEKVALPTGAFLGPKGTQGMVNWELEIASMVHGLPEPRSSLSQFNQRLPETGGLVVVLTGATGFIGRHLLSDLVQDVRVAQVHCLSLRPDQSGKPRHVSVKSEKVIEYSGDLSNLTLGLSDSQFIFLADHADIIIHNGADVSLLKSYQSLRRPNVLSTRTLCEMAIPRRVPVHYVSTASVAKAIQNQEERPLLETPASPADPKLLNLIDGYAASKWASETLLEKVAMNNGLPVYIHRLAHVQGDDASELDAIGMLTKYSLLLGALPQIEQEAVTGQWDFIEVDDVSRDLIETACESAIGICRSSSELTEQLFQLQRPIFFNHCNPVKTSHSELRNYLEGVVGKPLHLMVMGDWLKAAREKGLHPLVHEFFEAFDEGGGAMVLPVIAKTAQ